MNRILALTSASILGTLLLAGSASASSRNYIVVFKEGVAAGAAMTSAQNSLGDSVYARFDEAINGYAATLTDSQVKAIKADKRVESVSLDREVTINARPKRKGGGATAQTMPTGIDRFDADLSSAKSGDGTGTVDVNVAVIDTGIEAHPDLNVVGGTDCTTKRASTKQIDGNGHGTHVAGTIGAKDDGVGVVGVVPGARMWAVRVLNAQGSGTFSQIICGIDFVTSTRTDADPSNDIAVANMSLGGPGTDDGNCGKTNNDAMHTAICNSVAAGVTYVVAAGNESSDLKGAVPAAYDEVLTVSAIADFDGKPGGAGASTCRADQDDTAADFSNWATLPADQNHTIAAPGTCINSTWKGGGYNTISGTSMASPHAAGAAALCIATKKCTGAPAQIIQKLRSDAMTYTQANPTFGFAGDPQRPEAGKYYGFLTRAGLY